MFCRIAAMYLGFLLVLFTMEAVAMPTEKRTAFLIIDVQNCFVPGGSLAVANGDTIVEPINKILANHKFDLVVRSQDWHCKNHVSFASQHKVSLQFLPLGALYQENISYHTHLKIGESQK